MSNIIYRYILNIDVHKLHKNKNNLLLNRFNFKGDLYIHIPVTSTTKDLNVIMRKLCMFNSLLAEPP